MNKQAEINKLINIAMQIEKNGMTLDGIAKSMALFKGNDVNPVIIAGLNHLEYMTKENLPYIRRYMRYTYMYLNKMRNAIAEYIKDREFRTIKKELRKNRDEDLIKKRDKYLRKITNQMPNMIYFPVKNEIGFNLSEKSYFDDYNINFKFYTKLIHNITCLIPNCIGRKDFFDIQIEWLYNTNDISVMGLYNSIQASIIEYIDSEKINYCDPLKNYQLYTEVFRGELNNKKAMVSLCLSYMAFDLLGDKYLNAIYGGNIQTHNRKLELALLQIAMLHIINWCISFAKNEEYLLLSTSRDKLPYKLISNDDGIYVNNKLFVKKTEISKIKILEFIHDNNWNYMISYAQASQIGLKKKCLQKHVNELNKNFAKIIRSKDEILVSQRGIGYKLKYRFLDEFKN